MKVIFAGSRHGRPEGELAEAILASGLDITEVVHGGASGVDAQADAFARQADVPITRFPANWAMGKAGGPIRNRKMAEYADALIALDGGDGTHSMIREMLRVGKPVYVHPASNFEEVFK